MDSAADQASPQDRPREPAKPNAERVAVVVINMDRDSDRLAYMRRQLEHVGLPFERFTAIVGAQLPDELRDYFAGDESGFLSKGEIGCYASHLAVYQAIADGRIAAPALVLEDDVKLPDNLPELLQAILQALPPNWDFVRLSSPTKRAYVVTQKLGANHALARYSISPGSNGALLVSAAGARKFCRREPRRLPIDQDNRMLWRFDLDMFGVVPAPIGGNSLETSTIDDLTADRFRENQARQRFLRRKRALWRRHAWNIKQFGFGAWAASEAVNVVAPLIPKRVRAQFLASAGDWLGSIAKKPR